MPVTIDRQSLDRIERDILARCESLPEIQRLRVSDQQIMALRSQLAGEESLILTHQHAVASANTVPKRLAAMHARTQAQEAKDATIAVLEPLLIHRQSAWRLAAGAVQRAVACDLAIAFEEAKRRFEDATPRPMGVECVEHSMAVMAECSRLRCQLPSQVLPQEQI